MRHILLMTALPAIALAGETKFDCSLKADRGDLVAKGENLEVKAGQVVRDAVVVEGNLVLRKGASVKSAVVLRGNLTVEDGATVRDDVVVVGGTATVGRGAVVKGSRVVLDDGLRIVGEDGKTLDISVSFDGEPLGRKLAREILKDVHACRVEKE